MGGFSIGRNIKPCFNATSHKRNFVAAGSKFFRLNDNGISFGPEGLPTNMEKFDAAEKVSISDRSREMSGQQTSKIFSSGFMSGQLEHEDTSTSGSDTHGYEAQGNAQLGSVLQSHVPEPFSADDDGNNLKEGSEVSSGIGGQQRWTMEDRMEHSHQTHSTFSDK